MITSQNLPFPQLLSPVHYERLHSDHIFAHRQRKTGPLEVSQWAAVLNLLYFLLSAAPFQRPPPISYLLSSPPAAFAFLLSSGIDLSCFQPSIWPCDRIASNPLTVLISTERPGSPPALSLPDRSKIGHRRHGFCYRYGLHYFRLANTPVDFCGSLPLHIACDMGVDIQRGGTRDVPDDGGQGLDVHPMFQSVGGEHMTQVMKAYLFTSSVFQDFGQPVADNRGGYRSVFFLRGGEHPPGENRLLIFFQCGDHYCRQDHGSDGRFILRRLYQQLTFNLLDLPLNPQFSSIEVQKLYQ